MLFRPQTLQEANIVLPIIQDHLKEARSLIQEGQGLSEKIELETPDATLNTGELAVASTEHPATRRLLEIEENIQAELQMVQVYGGIVKGLFPTRLDLLSIRHNQPVYLCWQQGENKFGHWHPIEESYSTRRKIVDKKAFGSPVAH